MKQSLGILPCPFCGKEPREYKNHPPEETESLQLYTIRCVNKNCPTYPRNAEVMKFTRAKTRKAWNTRGAK